MQMINHGVSHRRAVPPRRDDLRASPHPPDRRAQGPRRRSPRSSPPAFMVVMLSSIGVPGLNGFVGEYLILIGSFLTARWWTVVAATGVILAALYLLWAYQRVFHGEPDEDNRTFPELRAEGRPRCCCRSSASSCSPACIPKPMLDRIEPSVKALITHVSDKTGYDEPNVPDADRGRGHTTRRRSRDRRDRSPDPRSRWFDLSPLLILLGAALVLLRRRLAHAAVAPRAVRGVLGHGRRRRRWSWRFVLWDDVTDQGAAHARRRRDHARHVLDVRHDRDRRRRAAGQPRHRRLPAPRADGRPRGLRPVPHRSDRRHRDGDGQRPDRAVPRPRDAVDLVLRARRQPPSPDREPGSRHQVLRARRLLVGVLPLRHRAHLRRHRQHQLRRDRRRRQRHRARPSARTRSSSPASRCCWSASPSRSSAVPFHFWTPDVYQGAPTPVTAFMASAGKVGCVRRDAPRARSQALPNWRDDWRPVIWVIAVATLVVGSILAVVQTNVKRMLAYSSISHAGFILVGVEAAGHAAGEADPGRGVSAVAALPAALRGAGARHVRGRHRRGSHRRRADRPRRRSVASPRRGRRSRWR